MEEIKISVIIPTRNRVDLLKPTLESIVSQNFPQENFEVIVVDNGSTDNTEVLCKNYYREFKNFTYLYEPTPGLHVGRNLGLKTAKGELLVYADDDIKAFPNWLEGIFESFKEAEVAAVGGKNLPLYEAPPPDWEEYLWENNKLGKINPYYSVLDFGDKTVEISPYFIFGCNFSIRKNILLEIGGFHPDGMPSNLIKYRGDGETAVAQAIIRKKFKSIYNPKASVYHWIPEGRLTFDYVYKRAFNAGVSASFTDIRALYLKQGIPLIISKFIFGGRNKFKRIKDILLTSILNDSDVKYHMLKGFRAGYDFHQREINDDRNLLEWVLKKNYLIE